MKKDFLQTIKIIILGLLLSTGISYAASLWGSPTANFPVGNKSTPINTSSSPQGIGQPFLGSLLHINGNKILGNLRSNGLAIFGNATIGSDLTVKNLIGAGDRTVCADIDGNIIVCPATPPPPPPPPPSNNYTLVIVKSGADAPSGTVTASPLGTPVTPCATTCLSYPSGTPVILTAAPGPNSAFTGWGGSGCSGTGTCTVTISGPGPQQVNAGFNSYFVSVGLAGQGTVTSTSSNNNQSNQINCGSTCSVKYPPGASVTLTATPSPGYTFSDWSGDCTNTTGTCTVSSPNFNNKSVTATFTATAPVPTVILAANPTSVPSGIASALTWSATNSPTSCTASATPANSNWSGTKAATGTVSTGGLTLDTTFALYCTNAGGNSSSVNTTVTVYPQCNDSYDNDGDTVWDFPSDPGCSSLTDNDETNQYTLTVSKPTYPQGGTVISNTGGINCGSTCSASYASGNTVSLTATAQFPFYTFYGWKDASGVTYPGCPGTGTCTITMPATNTIVTATFAPS